MKTIIYLATRQVGDTGTQNFYAWGYSNFFIESLTHGVLSNISIKYRILLMGHPKLSIIVFGFLFAKNYRARGDFFGSGLSAGASYTVSGSLPLHPAPTIFLCICSFCTAVVSVCFAIERIQMNF